jgi:hypothetical protein
MGKFLFTLISIFLCHALQAQTSNNNDCKIYLEKGAIIDSVNSQKHTIKVSELPKLNKIVSPYKGQTVLSFAYYLTGPGFEDAFTGEVNGDSFQATDKKILQRLMPGTMLIIGNVKVKAVNGQIYCLSGNTTYIIY